jgi:ketosteroid isomerase-like protein
MGPWLWIGESNSHIGDKIDMVANEIDTVELEVWQTVQEFNRAFAANDPDRYFEYIDPEIVVLTPGNPYRIEGLEHDRQEFEFGLREGYSRVGYFQELQPKIQCFGEVAVVTYYSRGYYGPEGKARTAYLKETDVLVRRETGWKIVHIHVSAGSTS